MDWSVFCLLCNFLQRNLANWVSFSHLFFSAVSIYSTACMKLEEYETAKVALEKGASLAPGDSRFTNLIKECDEHIAGTYLTSTRWSRSFFYLFCEVVGLLIQNAVYLCWNYELLRRVGNKTICLNICSLDILSERFCFFISEETDELQKQSLETAPTDVVLTKDVPPVMNVSSTNDVQPMTNVSNQATEAEPARPKYRSQILVHVRTMIDLQTYLFCYVLSVAYNRY